MKSLGKIAAAVLLVCAMAGLVACSSSSSSASSSAGNASFSKEVGDSKTAPTEPFYVLVCGRDTRTGTVDEGVSNHGGDGSSRTDVNMLVRVDPKTYQITLVTIPRDTKVSFGGANHKFSEAYWLDGGIQGTLKQVKALTGITPDYYMDMTFVSFADFYNQFEGFRVNVPVDMSMKDILTGEEMKFPAGDNQELSGNQMLVLARERKKYNPLGDVWRQVQDRNIVKSSIAFVAAQPEKSEEYVDLLLSCLPETNMDRDTLLALVKDFSAHADQIKFVEGTGPYDGDTDSSDGNWYTTRDEATWAKIMNVTNSGGDPSGLVPLPEQPY